ncbi:MAG: hypothetical protein WCA35_20515 [Kovacikia sp.]
MGSGTIREWNQRLTVTTICPHHASRKRACQNRSPYGNANPQGIGGWGGGSGVRFTVVIRWLTAAQRLSIKLVRALSHNPIARKQPVLNLNLINSV